MKIYLADTFQREHLNYHNDLDLKNHLESFFKLMRERENLIKSWRIFNENRNQ